MSHDDARQQPEWKPMADDSRAGMREVLADKLKGYEQFAPFVQMLLYDPREKLTKLLDASVQAGVDFAAAAVAAERERCALIAESLYADADDQRVVVAGAMTAARIRGMSPFPFEQRQQRVPT